jgi:hypothetical protein
MAYGAALLLKPRAALGRVGVRRAHRALVATARLLGARNVVQAAAEARFPGARGRDLGAAVDAVHAASMLAFAAPRSDRRRPALASAAVAGLLCAEELHPLRRSI